MDDIEGTRCVMVMTFHGQDLKLFSYRVLPAVPSVGDSIDDHKVIRVKPGRLPVVVFLWSRVRESHPSMAATLPEFSDSSSP